MPPEANLLIIFLFLHGCSEDCVKRLSLFFFFQHTCTSLTSRKPLNCSLNVWLFLFFLVHGVNGSYSSLRIFARLRITALGHPGLHFQDTMFPNQTIPMDVPRAQSQKCSVFPRKFYQGPALPTSA